MKSSMVNLAAATLHNSPSEDAHQLKIWEINCESQNFDLLFCLSVYLFIYLTLNVRF